MSHDSNQEPRPNQVPITLPSGEQAWVSADAFNLISEKEFRDSERLRRLRDQRNLAAGVAAVALIVFAAGTASLLTRRDRSAGSVGGAAHGAVEARAASTGPTGAETARPATTPDLQEIEEAVRGWARAWSARDVESVLGYYSPSFLVPDGMSHATWELLRRERITSPELLGVTVSGLTVERTGPESAVARCLQTYDTPGYRVRVMKTLKLTKASGSWLIVDELASLAEVGPGSSGEVVATSDPRG